MRLQVFLSHNGVCSRREAMGIIQEGRVTVNGKQVREPSYEVQGTEEIRVNGKPVAALQYTYIMLHKPVGVTTTKDDPHADKTVMDLLPKNLQHVSPVGRLDRDTEGLLLLTNDGAWAQALTHPRYHVQKTYAATVDGELSRQSAETLQKGIIMEGRKTAPCRIADVRYNSGQTKLMITIHEGRKRQVRTMFYLMGHKVLYLKRVAIGALKLGDLPKGQWRLLTPKEKDDLEMNSHKSREL